MYLLYFYSQYSRVDLFSSVNGKIVKLNPNDLGVKP